MSYSVIILFMSNEVMFDEDNGNNRVGNIAIVPGAPKGMLAWLVKNKIVKNGKQGEQFLLGIAVVAVLLAVSVYYLFVIPHPLTLKVTSEPGPHGTLIPVLHQ